MSNPNKILKEFIDNLVNTSNIKNQEDLIKLRDDTIALISDFFYDHLDSVENIPLDFICSDEVTLEVIDEKTSRIFKRKLDISYVENSNGIRLQGENFEGKPSEIVFLSNTAIDKIKDVIGLGLNTSPCNH
ncbi:hypothetical protein [Terrisporobacter sp.]